MIRMVNLSLGALVLLLPALLDSSLKGVVLLAGLGLIAMGMRHASAAARHLVWLVGMAGLLALPVLSIVLPNWRVLPSWMPASESVFARVPAMRQSSTVNLLSASRDASSAPTPWPITGSLAASAPSAAVRSGRSGSSPSAPTRWLGGLWAVGAGFLILRLLACSLWLRIVTRRADPLHEGPLAKALAAARADLGIRRPVRLLLDERRVVPLVWGAWHPRLILPGEACAWEPSRVRAVLLHELAHVKRYDLAVLWLTQVVCAIHWFNPLVWLAAWRLHVERERACDDLVLGAGVRAADYAEHLLHVATKLDLGSPEGALAMARPAGLEGRLMAVLNARLNRRGVSRTLAVAAVAVGLCVVIPVAMLKAADKEPATRDSAELAETRDQQPAVEWTRDEVGSPVVQSKSLHPNADDTSRQRALLADLVRGRLQGAESELKKASTADQRDQLKRAVAFLESELNSLTAHRSQSKTNQAVADSANAGQRTEPVGPGAVVVIDPNQPEPKDPFASLSKDTLILDIADDGSLQFAGKAISLEALDDAIAAEQKAKPELKIAIRASAKVAYARLVRVLDTLKKAQVTSVSVMTREDDAKGLAPAKSSQPEAGTKSVMDLREATQISEAKRVRTQRDAELALAGRDIAAKEVDQHRSAQGETDGERLVRLERKYRTSQSELANARLRLEELQASPTEISLARLHGADDDLKRARESNDALAAREVELAKKAGLDSLKDSETVKGVILPGLGADAARAELASAQARLKRISDLVNVARLEHVEAEAAVTAAMTRLEQAEGDSKQAPAGAEPAGVPKVHRDTPEMEVAQAEEELARVNVEAAVKRFQRIEVLADKSTVSGTEREEAKASLDKSQAALRVAEARRRLLLAPVRQKTVTVLGQVNQPGLVVLQPGQEMDLLEAIGHARGTTRRANTKKVEVSRRGRTEKLDLDELRRATDPGKKYLLEPGDVVFVPESVF